MSCSRSARRLELPGWPERESERAVSVSWKQGGSCFCRRARRCTDLDGRETRPRYRLVDDFYDKVKGSWEERFERTYGFWRGFVDGVVLAVQACGDFEGGFALVHCDECRAEYLVAFSCSRRVFCPSCTAKLAAIFGALLREEILEEVGHAQWVFTLPKLIRPYFLQHRELDGLEAGGSASADLPPTAERRRLRRAWAQMVRRIYEVDPLTYRCGAQMRVVSFILDPRVITKILRHIAEKGMARERPPPSGALLAAESLAAAASLAS